MKTKEIEKIQNELKDYIAALTNSENKINLNATLDNMNVDSLALVKIFVFVEKNFGVSLVDSGLNRENIETLGKLADHIYNLMQKRQ